MSKWGRVELEGVDDIKQIFDSRKTKLVIKKYLSDAVLVCDGVTKKNTPVDTGHLRNSFSIGDVVVNNNGGYVDYFNTAEYAMYVEFGHRTVNNKWVEGHFMMQQGINKVENTKDKLFHNAMGIFSR